MGRHATTHAYLIFLADPAVDTPSRVVLAPIAHDDFPGAAASGFGGHTLVQVGDVAYTGTGHRVQREQQLPDDAFTRATIRVPDVATLTGLLGGQALDPGLPPIDAGDPGEDVRYRKVAPVTPGFAAVLLGEDGGAVSPKRTWALLDAFETAHGVSEDAARPRLGNQRVR